MSYRHRQPPQGSRRFQSPENSWFFRRRRRGRVQRLLRR